MKKIIILFFISVLGFSCIKEDQVYTTFTGDLIYSYLKKDTAYSEFVKIIDKSGFRGMLSAYGSYTCLAPNNTAFRKFYTLNNKTFDQLEKSQVDTIMRNHIIVNKFLVANLSNGTLPSVNMNGIRLPIVFTTDNTTRLKIIINDSCQVVSKDNVVYNGVVQGINDVIIPTKTGFAQALKQDTSAVIFYKALVLTNLADSLTLINDDSYQVSDKYKEEKNYIIPTKRKFGYTAFVESDKIFKSYGINTINDLIQKAKTFYPCDPIYDNQFTNRNNSLNQFISYHLVNKALYYNTFFYTRNAIKNYTPDEFLETMLTNHIIRVSRVNSDITLNTSTDYTTIVPSDASKSTVNGVYHYISKMLVYSDNVEQMLNSTRIRFDVACLFPELTNNNIRASEGQRPASSTFSADRYEFQDGYLANIKMSKDTRFLYLSGLAGQWANFQADEFDGSGKFDLTIRLLPVPPGTYELRYGYSAHANRSITQIYVDGKPVGIPIDLRIPSTDPRIGYLADIDTEDSGFENDKMMRNRGYMKAPNTYLFGSTILRDYSGGIRRIIGTFTFNDYKPHYIRFKSVLDDNAKFCMMDYFEYVPKSVYSPADGEPEGRD